MKIETLGNYTMLSGDTFGGQMKAYEKKLRTI